MKFTHLKSYTIDRGYSRLLKVIYYETFTRLECAEDGTFTQKEYKDIFVDKYGEIIHIDEIIRRKFKVY